MTEGDGLNFYIDKTATLNLEGVAYPIPFLRRPVNLPFLASVHPFSRSPLIRTNPASSQAVTGITVARKPAVWPLQVLNQHDIFHPLLELLHSRGHPCSGSTSIPFAHRYRTA